MDNYLILLKNCKNKNICIYDDKDNLLIKIPKYPILVWNQLDINYYNDIFRYLYVVKNYLTIERYPEYITCVSNKITRENKKREFRKKANKFFLDHDDKLYRKIILNDKVKE